MRGPGNSYVCSQHQKPRRQPFKTHLVGLASSDVLLRLRSRFSGVADFLRSTSSASWIMALKTSFECLKRSRSLSSSAFADFAALRSDCCFRATVRLKGSFFLGMAGCVSAMLREIRADQLRKPKYFPSVDYRSSVREWSKVLDAHRECDCEVEAGACCVASILCLLLLFLVG